MLNMFRALNNFLMLMEILLIFHIFNKNIFMYVKYIFYKEVS